MPIRPKQLAMSWQQALGPIQTSLLPRSQIQVTKERLQAPVTIHQVTMECTREAIISDQSTATVMHHLSPVVDRQNLSFVRFLTESDSSNNQV